MPDRNYREEWEKNEVICFLEAFNSNTPILILDENRKIIDENIVGEVTQKIMNQREVLNARPEKDKLVVITCIDSAQ